MTYDFSPIADLKIQAMLFDMDIDYETMSLVPKQTYKEAVWLTRWKDKQADADFDTNIDIDKDDIHG